MNISEVMTAEEQKRYINNLIDFLDKQKEYEERLSKLDEMLARVESLKISIKDEINKRKAAERKAKDLKAKLKLARLNK